EAKAQVDEHLGLLPAAVESVRDAAANPDAAQLLQDRIDRTAQVQDRRQVVTPRQLELRDEKFELPGRIDVCDEMIEADFPDRTCGTACEVRLEDIEIVVVGSHDVHRVNTEGWTDILSCGREAKNRVEPLPLD